MLENHSTDPTFEEEKIVLQDAPHILNTFDSRQTCSHQLTIPVLRFVIFISEQSLHQLDKKSDLRIVRKKNSLQLLKAF